jgi:imidazolonepropionase-like amidohydrolase
LRGVRDQRELAQAIEEQAGWGVDAIKLQISASAVQSDDPPRECSFSSQELRAAVKLSHEAGLLVCAHAEGDGPIRAALRAGVDVVQHASFVSRDTLREIRAGESRLVFTPGVYRAIARNGPAAGYPPDGLRRVARHWGAMVRAIQDAAEAGIAFGVGSDAGGAVHPHGEYLEDVISLVSDCHFPVAFALTAATRGAALAAQLDAAGTLQVGAPADLVLAQSELVHHDLEAMRRASNLTVIQKGKVRRIAAVNAAASV